MKGFSIQHTKMLLFLINFFDGIGLAFNYPWYIFYNQNYSSSEVNSFWERHNQTNHPTQLYLHTLFCETKCHYCNCISYVDNDQGNFVKYKYFLFQEIDNYSKIITKDLDTLYFWWGTFSLWNEQDMEEILIKIKKSFNFKKNYTWMVELHPESTNRKKLEILKKYWVTNVMIGLQSLNKKVSEKNNRPYNEWKIIEVIDDIVDLRFNKVCFDIMYNLPYETYEDLEENLCNLKKIGERISWKINMNLEINKWNMSYNVPFYKIWINDNFSKLQDFLEDFFRLLDRKTALIKSFKEKSLNSLFGHNREEIDSRKKNNSAILGIGYWAISYVPWIATYSFDFSYKKIKSFYGNTKFKWHNLSEQDNINFSFLNNIRSWFDPVIMQSALSSISQEALRHFKKIQKSLKLSSDWKITAQLENDLLLHQMSLCFYSYSKRKDVMKWLVKKWFSLGNSVEDLEDNIDNYLELYYKKD